MFGAMLDFFCSRPFPEKLSTKHTLISFLRALFWGLVAMCVGMCFVEDAARIGEHATWCSIFTGTGITAQESNPLLWTIVRLFIGESPSIFALNMLGAVIFGGLVAATWGVVRFWALDAASEESVSGSYRWFSPIAADVSCAFLIFSFPGLLGASSFNVNTWNFFLLLICVLLQNRYALRGGHRVDMAIFATVLGLCVIESAWVALLLPIFFCRVIAIEWRLWDHNVRNLAIWFIAFVFGALLMMFANALRVPEGSMWATQIGVAHLFWMIYKTIFVPGIIIIFGASVILPFVAWVTARRLLNNDRSMGLLVVASVMTLIMFGLYFAFPFDKDSFIPQVLLTKIPVRFWMTYRGMGDLLYPMLPVASLPVATMWVNAVALGMLMVGWSVQVVLKNPNGYEERDVGRIPKGVLAMRTGAFIIAPLMLVLILIAIITHAVAFGETNRYAQSEGVPQGAYTSMADQFGDYVVKQLASDSGSLAAGHTYIASTTNMHWMMTPVAAAAKRQNVNVVQFDALRESETRYIEWVRANLKKDTRLTDAGVDLRHLNDMLDYNFNRFILTLFAQHSNVKQYVAVYDICDYWFRARMRPVPAGAVFIGVNDVDALDYAEPLWAEHLELRKQWGFVKDYAKTATSWTDVNLDTAKQIAEHLAFVANNLGTYYDDMASTIVSVNEGPAEAREKSELYLQRAVDCYRYANEMNPENISAIFNYYAICNARPAAKKILDPLDKQRSVEKFNAFIKVAEEKKRRYNLPETIRFHGYIRDPRLFASVGLTWAIQAAPDAALATYRSAELNLKGMGDEKGAARINVAMGAIYEDQGQLDLAEQKYLDAEKMDPNDINVLRQLMSLSLQRGNLQDASAYLRRVEDIIRETHENDAELQAKLLLDKAAYYMGIGDKKKARDILATYTKDYQDDVVGWSMLAMLNIDEGRLDEVKGYIAVNIRRAKNTEPYYTHILDGRLAQAEAERLSQLSPGTPPHENVAIRKHYEDARAYYRSAYASRPNMANVVQMILQIDFVLHDSVDAIRDAETLLQCDPNNPMAFYALGMKRLEDAEVLGSTGAEGYFVRAIENAQKRQMAVPLELLVNAADVLSRTDAAAKLAKAEEFATEAMRRVNGTPNEYLATSTYALVLAHMGKLNEAKRMLAYTRNLLSGRPEIPQLDFVDIWIAIKAGQTTEARRLLNTLRSKLGANASKLDQFDLNLAEQALK